MTKLQTCIECNSNTGLCEDDGFAFDGKGPLCESCYDKNREAFVKKFPKRIFIQVDDEAKMADFDFSETTFYEDKINRQDVEYIRADLIERKSFTTSTIKLPGVIFDSHRSL